MSVPDAAPAPSAGSGVGLGLRTAWLRLRTRRAVLVAFLAFTLSLIAAVIELGVSSAGALGRAHIAVARLAFPLTAFGVCSVMLGARSWNERIATVARFGAAGRMIAMGLLAASFLATTAVFLLCTLGVVGVTFRSAEPLPLASELWIATWVAIEAAFAYSAWFAVGATFLRAGRGRWIMLGADLLLGGFGVFGLVAPSGHSASLLGAPAPFGVGQAASSVILPMIGLALAIVALLRSRR